MNPLTVARLVQTHAHLRKVIAAGVKSAESFTELAERIKKARRAFSRFDNMANKTTSKKKATPPPGRPKKMNAAEAVYSLMAFLTTRSRPLIMSAHHDSAPVAKIVGEFVKFHKLPALREGMIAPTFLDLFNHVSNEPTEKATIFQPTPDESIHQAVQFITAHDTTTENHVVAKVIQKLKTRREAKAENLKKEHALITKNLTAANESLEQFEAICRGDFDKLNVG